jgi:hypothetical protein
MLGLDAKSVVVGIIIGYLVVPMLLGAVGQKKVAAG